MDPPDCLTELRRMIRTGYQMITGGDVEEEVFFEKMTDPPYVNQEPTFDDIDHHKAQPVPGPRYYETD